MKTASSKRPHFLIRIFAFSLALASSISAQAETQYNTSFFGNVAIDGYDVVAYFTENKAVKGLKKFETEWHGANWRFSSTENLEKFKANPQQYAPQYGGYCAYAVAKNGKAGIDPRQFSVHNGKLYLNYNKKINQKWLANRDNFIVDADRNWPKLSKK